MDFDGGKVKVPQVRRVPQRLANLLQNADRPGDGMLVQSGIETDKLRISGGTMRLLNLTPHDLVLYNEAGDKEIARIPVAGEAARVSTQAAQIGKIFFDGHDVPVVVTTFGDVVNLPEPQDGTTYIVSILVAQTVRGQRDDVVAPDTGPQSVVRDGEGNILGVRRFTR